MYNHDTLRTITNGFALARVRHVPAFGHLRVHKLHELETPSDSL